MKYVSHDSLVFISSQNVAINIGCQNDRFSAVSKSLKVSIIPKVYKNLVATLQRTLSV